ncbi:hypothetical protein [Kribbella deserti]|uniref:Uncharacterized protein n=1 Tax=Kribbella deserti TaxID=1926257 RepID=A0ABV6QMF2_9ACTN
MTSQLPLRERAGAWLLLLGTLTAGIGLTWDVQWHADVGPDTFFTAPHLVMYLGSAITGLTSLIVVLLTTRAARDTAAMPAVTVMRVFRTPLPFLICGTAAAAGLLYGLTDLWWHTVYGFDVTPTSPPHVAMSLMTLFDTAGLIFAFIMLRSTSTGRVGLAVAAVAGIPGLVFLCYSTPRLPGVDSILLAICAISVLVVTAAAAALRETRSIVVIAAAYAAMHALFWVVPIPATKVYADSLGLGMRDYASGVPAMPVTFPFALPIAVLVLAGGLALGRRRNWALRPVVLVLGGLTGLIVALGYVPVFTPPALTIVAAVPVGVLSGWFGWHLGTAGRLASAPVSTPARKTLVEV